MIKSILSASTRSSVQLEYLICQYLRVKHLRKSHQLVKSVKKININNSCKYSRFTATRTMSETDIFKFSDYDFIGFDLDNTLLRYNIPNMMKMEYEVLAKFLVEQKGYSAEFLYKPYELDIDFIQKGLILDFKHGNVIKLGFDGVIQKASHGTKMMTTAEILECYGEERKWIPTTAFCSNFLVAWNGPLSECFRTVLDYFDMPASLIFARIVDSIDYENKIGKYNIWPDILDGLIYMFSREHFQDNYSEYFKEMKQSPEKYIHKTHDKVLDWLKQVKTKKTTFLLTGSHIDFANLTASYALGHNWRNLFDVIICYAKKPGFFINLRKFYELDNTTETKMLSRDELKLNTVYTQGNTEDLMFLLNKKIKNRMCYTSCKTKVLYVGDNLVQDVFTPAKFINWDTVAVCEEILTEKDVPTSYLHPDYETIKSDYWGSYFLNDDNDLSLWASTINQYSKICIPNMDVIADKTLDYQFKCFTESDNKIGYYPPEARIA